MRFPDAPTSTLYPTQTLYQTQTNFKSSELSTPWSDAATEQSLTFS